MDDKNNFVILALVAIVSIVALVVLVTTNQDSSTSTVVELPFEDEFGSEAEEGEENIGGQTRYGWAY